MMQKIRSKCMDSSSISDVPPSVFDFTPLLDEVENNNFRGSLPPLHSQHIKGVDNVVADSLSRNSSTSAKKDQSSDRVEKNSHQRPEWILPSETNISDAFPKESFALVPSFDPGASFCEIPLLHQL